MFRKTKTQKKGGKHKNTRKNHMYKHPIDRFPEKITIQFLEMLLMIKLYHWKTHSYATHKATDELYSSLNENMDKFIEVLLGKTHSRLNLMKHKTIHLNDLNNHSALVDKIKSFKNELIDLDKNSFMKSMGNNDLLNIRDEILGNLNQFLYLLTFK